MFDSPFTYCPRCKQMVVLDQTQKECAHEHGCRGTNTQCPLLSYFTGIHFRPEAAEEGERECSKPTKGASSGARRSTHR